VKFNFRATHIGESSVGVPIEQSPGQTLSIHLIETALQTHSSEDARYVVLRSVLSSLQARVDLWPRSDAGADRSNGVNLVVTDDAPTSPFSRGSHA
jgi:hypothetical protein